MHWKHKDRTPLKGLNFWRREQLRAQRNPLTSILLEAPWVYKCSSVAPVGNGACNCLQATPVSRLPTILYLICKWQGRKGSWLIRRETNSKRGSQWGKQNDRLQALDVCLPFLCQREYLLIKPKKANVYPMGKLEHQNLREEWVGVVSEPGEEPWGRKGI